MGEAKRRKALLGENYGKVDTGKNLSGLGFGVVQESPGIENNSRTDAIFYAMQIKAKNNELPGVVIKGKIGKYAQVYFCKIENLKYTSLGNKCIKQLIETAKKTDFSKQRILCIQQANYSMVFVTTLQKIDEFLQNYQTSIQI